MDEIKAEAIDILIHSVMATVLGSDMEDADCEMVIHNAIEEIAEMMTSDYRNLLREKFIQALDDMDEHIHGQIVVENIMKDLGWGSEHTKSIDDTEPT